MSAHPYRTPAALPSSGVILAARALRSTRFVVPAGMAALVTAIAIFFACLVLGACTPLEAAIAQAGLDDIQCALANIDLPDDQIILKCFDAKGKQLSAEEKQRVIDAVKAERAARAQVAADAKKMGCAQADAGAK